MNRVALLCVGGPEDGRIVDMDDRCSRYVIFPYHEPDKWKFWKSFEEVPLEYPRFRRCEYMISWRTCSAYFDGVYG